MILYAAKHLLPVASPPIQSGAVVVAEGRIVAAGRRKDVVRAHPDAEVRDLGDAVIIPGLVNAHTHIELSWAGGAPPPPGGFVAWLARFVAERDRVAEEEAIRAARAALATMAARGTVAIGDVANGTWTARLIAESPLYGSAFHEVFGLKAADAETILAAAAERLTAIEADPVVAGARGRVSAILTPHAAYSTSAPLLKALGGRAVASGEILSIHVAESEAEVQFLRDGTGPMRDFLEARGGYDDTFRASGLSPVEHLDRLGVLTPSTLAVHCVHVLQQDLARLQARGVTVVTCPRSNKRLETGVAPVPKLLASGVPVALGTDSLATAPEIDLFNEVAALREEHPGLAPAAALRIATINGAAALGLAKDLGTVEPGKLAALAVVGLPDPNDDPLEAVTWSSESVATLEAAAWEPATR